MNKPEPSQQIDIDFTTSSQFTEFLTSLRVSLVLSTYQTGSLFFIGPGEAGKLNISTVNLKRSMGLWVQHNSLYVASLCQIWRFENILPPGQQYQGSDRLFVPQVAWTTGDLDSHDLALEDSGRLVFVNTRYSCLATTNASHNFIPLWQPPCISVMTPEDRCHLNGLALRDGKVAYATALSTLDKPHSWRDVKADGGVLWDLKTNETLLTGLAMPHSPRWHQDKLWLLESGRGQFGWVDLTNRQFQPLVFLPGYLRGLTFYGDYAFIGTSLPRENSGFHGLTSAKNLAERSLPPQCGVFVVDIKRGEVVHEMTVTGGVQELYDVAILTDCSKPRAIDFTTDDIHYLLAIGEPSSL